MSGHCQIILKKRMLRTKKPNQEKIKVKIKTSDQTKPLNITFPLTSTADNSKIYISDSIHSAEKRKTTPG